MTIEELDLSVRSFNCLKRAGINTVEDLINRSEEDMMKGRNLGRKSLEEVIWKLASPDLRKGRRINLTFRIGVNIDAGNQKIGQKHRSPHRHAAGPGDIGDGRMRIRPPAKEVRSLAEKMITIAKEDSLQNQKFPLPGEGSPRCPCSLS